MPRWASRIDLEVTGVRVERLQDISEEDAIAEGIQWHRNGYWYVDGTSILSYASAVDCYRLLFERINGPGSWDANPWVWCISFRVVV